jgi:hypothetical protein
MGLQRVEEGRLIHSGSQEAIQDGRYDGLGFGGLREKRNHFLCNMWQW